jgi:arylsulfatase A-like enzyme
MRKIFLVLFVILMGVVRGERPNFLLILTDDHGYGDVSMYGDSDVRTPNIDRIGEEGMIFTRMRSNCTVCSPTRAAILTGKDADRVGVPGVIRTHAENSWGYFDPTVDTLADLLGEAGYRSGIVGKWHLGLESPNLPRERGFGHFHGFLGDMMDDYWRHSRHGQNYMRKDEEVLGRVEGHATEVFTDWAIEFLEGRVGEDAPFFLYLAYNAPHFPIQPPEEWVDRVRQRSPEMERKRMFNVAFVEHLDDGIGRLLAALGRLGLEERTMVVFTADNGGSLPHAQNNDPWRGGKQEHYDGGLRVPFAVRWPAGLEAGGRSDVAGLTYDLFPTFLELAGAELPEDLDARSLVPALRGEGGDDPERVLYFVRREGGMHGGLDYHAVVKGDWKLLRNGPFEKLELYHLGDDPGEEKDLAGERPEVLRELLQLMRERVQRAGAVPWQG